MIKNHFFRTFLLVSVLLGVTGFTLKALHKPGTEILLIACVITVIIYTVTALREIYQSANVDKTEKIMWTVGFLLFNGITAILYLITGQRRVLREYHFNRPGTRDLSQNTADS